jgi:protein N-terminal amidase
MLKTDSPMRIACLQFDPKLGRVAENQARADELLGGLRDPDILVLPEMAFTGYGFTGRDEILGYCEDADSGPTSSWARATAKRLGCHVVCGFPERTRDGPLYNAMLIANPAGAIVHLYRKHFLYMTDETWAAEGPAFGRVALEGIGRCGLGICMDLNPYLFTAPSGDFEFASSLFDPPLAPGERGTAERFAVDVVLLSNAWLRSPTDLHLSDAEHTAHLLQYWAWRLRPALGKPAIVALANRVGEERGVKFAGASCVIDLKTRTVLGNLDGESEGVLVVDTNPDHSDE